MPRLWYVILPKKFKEGTNEKQLTADSEALIIDLCAKDRNLIVVAGPANSPPEEVIDDFAQRVADRRAALKADVVPGATTLTGAAHAGVTVAGAGADIAPPG